MSKYYRALLCFFAPFLLAAIPASGQELDAPAAPPVDSQVSEINTLAPTAQVDQLDASQPTTNSSESGFFDSTFKHFRAYEPIYFVYGPWPSDIKFQFSVKYKFYDPSLPMDRLLSIPGFLQRIYFAYSQTSLWDLQDPNEPFFYDSSYRPEGFVEIDKTDLPGLSAPKNWDYNVLLGGGHESNGQKIPDHRAMNSLFIQPTITFNNLFGDDTTNYFLLISPRIHNYADDISQNPDIPKYRGYCDFNAAFGQADGWQISFLGRLGSSCDQGSAQFDWTYPLQNLLKGVDLCLDIQYFVGYGDTLLDYNRSTSKLRIGVCLYRY